MPKIRRPIPRHSRRGARAAVVATMLASPAAFAQQAQGTTDAAANGPGQLEAVTVTAERRTENIKDVPIVDLDDQRRDARRAQFVRRRHPLRCRAGCRA